VLVEYHGFLNFTKLKTILLEQYGKPDQPNRLMENYFCLANVDIYFDTTRFLKRVIFIILSDQFNKKEREKR